MAVKPVPENFHTVTPYLTCGDGVKALEFYKAAFGAREMYKMLTPDGRLGHAELRIGDSAVMLGGECLEYGNKSPQTLGGTPVTIDRLLGLVNDGTTQSAVRQVPRSASPANHGAAPAPMARFR
mgnify:CR=1 FL=1